MITRFLHVLLSHYVSLPKRGSDDKLHIDTIVECSFDVMWTKLTDYDPSDQCLF